jgi:hypothetical protein
MFEGNALKLFDLLSPEAQLRTLLRACEEMQRQQKEMMEIITARGEMCKIAIAAMQRAAIDPTEPRNGPQLATALIRMKEIWETIEKQTGGQGV